MCACVCVLVCVVFIYFCEHVEIWKCAAFSLIYRYIGIAKVIWMTNSRNSSTTMHFAWHYSVSVLTFTSMEYKFKSGRCYRRYFFIHTVAWLWGMWLQMNQTHQLVRFVFDFRLHISVCEVYHLRQRNMRSCDFVGLKLKMSVFASMVAWLKNQFLFTFMGNTFLYILTWNGG